MACQQRRSAGKTAAACPLEEFSAGRIILLVAGQAQAQIALDRPRHLASVLHLADGFDFPVGKPDGRGYYKARGFRADSHPGEDWDGVGGGNSDFNDPVNSIADGEVTFAGDAHSGWGNVVIVRHRFQEGGETKTVESTVRPS